MTGAMQALATSGANPTSPPPPPPPPQIVVNCAGAQGNITGASGTTIGVPSNVSSPGDPDNTFTYSLVKTSGSSKIALFSTTAATSSAGPTYSFSWTGLSVGEQAVANYQLTASKSGYSPGDAYFSIDLTRTS